jgi:hypothetical protein
VVYIVETRVELKHGTVVQVPQWIVTASCCLSSSCQRAANNKHCHCTCKTCQEPDTRLCSRVQHQSPPQWQFNCKTSAWAYVSWNGHRIMFNFFNQFFPARLQAPWLVLNGRKDQQGRLLHIVERSLLMSGVPRPHTLIARNTFGMHLNLRDSRHDIFKCVGTTTSCFF